MLYGTRNTTLKKPEVGDHVLISDLNDNTDYIDSCICKGQWDAAIDPTANDDILDGYVPGSIWINSTAHKIFTCEDNTETAAIWRQTYPIFSPGGDYDFGSYEVRAQTLYSDVATGTAPLKVDSTTKVTNLNVDRFDDRHYNEFVYRLTPVVADHAASSPISLGSAPAKSLVQMLVICEEVPAGPPALTIGDEDDADSHFTYAQLPILLNASAVSPQYYYVAAKALRATITSVGSAGKWRIVPIITECA